MLTLTRIAESDKRQPIQTAAHNKFHGVKSKSTKLQTKLETTTTTTTTKLVAAINAACSTRRYPAKGCALRYFFQILSLLLFTYK